MPVILDKEVSYKYVTPQLLRRVIVIKHTIVMDALLQFY